MEEDLQATQPTQNILDPRRIGKQNSGFSDEDVSDIICLLVPYSDLARIELAHMASNNAKYILGKGEARNVEPNYEAEDHAGRFEAPTHSSDHSIILRLSSRTRNPLAGFVFGRFAPHCDVCFALDTHKRVSNSHFRIFVNEYGVVMLEDMSTNGTLVDDYILKGKEHRNAMRTLTPGTRIKIPMRVGDEDLEFLVRIPRRDGDYDRAYAAKVHDHFRRLRELAQARQLHRQQQQQQQQQQQPQPQTDKLVGPDRDGHLKVWPQNPNPNNNNNIAPPSAPPTCNLPPTPGQAQLAGRKKIVEQTAREWTGSEKYSRERHIGKGAFAIVYKVVSRYDGRPYAAKELDKQRFLRNGVINQKVENEMKIMRKLRHPNIVQFIEHLDQGDGLLIIIMEYVPGGDLGKLINNEGRLPEPCVKTMAQQMLGALNHLHENNITHRDIKPDNILVKSIDPLEFKLTDFGLSKMVNSDQTFLRTFCGTLLYCAPEVYTEFEEYDQAGVRHREWKVAPSKRLPYDHAVDIWSLGGVLFFALTGSPPYPVRNGTSYSEILHQIMTTQLNTMPLLHVGISREGVDFLRRMLQKWPEERATVQELCDHPWLQQGRDLDNADDQELEVGASQLSIIDNGGDGDEEGESNHQEEIDIPDYSMDMLDESDSEANNTFGPPGANAPLVSAAPRLFGEVNASAIGSSGVIPTTNLNLPTTTTTTTNNNNNNSNNPAITTSSTTGSSYVTEILIPQDSAIMDSELGLGLHPARQTQAAAQQQQPTDSRDRSQWLSRGQSPDQLYSLIEEVASQQLDAGKSTAAPDHPRLKSVAESQIILSNADLNTSKRKPAAIDSSEDFDDIMADKDKPAFKRLKSAGNMIDGLAEEQREEYKLLASVPPIRKTNSARLFDDPVDKKTFWELKDYQTWHNNYPEMTQLQHEAFNKAAKEKGEVFGPTSSYWKVAMKYFAPTQFGGPGDFAQTTTTTSPSMGVVAGDVTQGMVNAAIQTVTDLGGSSSTAAAKRFVIPVSSPERVLAVLTSHPDSAVKDITVRVTDSLASWGRAVDNFQVYEPSTEAKVPKYAFKLLLWKEGFDSSRDPTKTPNPWEAPPPQQQQQRPSDDDPNSYAYYISSKASKGIWVNDLLVESDEARSPRGPSKNWTRVYDGDHVSVWGRNATSTSSGTARQTKLVFRGLWGGSALARPAGTRTELVAASTARKLDSACQRTERRVRVEREIKRREDEARLDLHERKANVQREKERSRAFEAKCQEAARALGMSNPETRRGSPALATLNVFGASVGVGSARATTM